MVLAAWCMAVVLGSLVLVGVPVTWLLGGRKPLNEWGWVQVPFLGMAAIVLVLQNLVYLDVPVGVAAPFLWGGVALLWLVFLRSGQVPVSLGRCPKALYGLFLLAYLVQGGGLLAVGAPAYVGRGWGDQLNYDIIARFVLEERHSLLLQEVADRPCYCHLLGLGLQHDRLGQSVLHAFFAATSRASVRALFEPTAFLSSALLVPALYALCRRYRLGGRLALAAGAVGGVLPAVTLIHQESFLSHGLATPLLLYLPAALNEFSERPTWRRLAGLGMLFAAASSVYTEYWGLYAGLTVLILGGAAVRHPRARLLLAGAVVLPPSAVLLLPGSLQTFCHIQGRVGMLSAGLNNTYPWALKVEGLGRLWAGDLAVAWLVGAAGLGITLLGTCGLFGACGRHLRADRAAWRSSKHWTALSFAAGTLTLAALPALILAQDVKHVYQFYKLLLSVSPLLVVGLALLGRAPPAFGATAPPNGVARRPFRLFPALTLGPAVVLGLAGTVQMVRQTTRPTFRSARFPGAYLLEPETREVLNVLEQLRGRRLLITSPEGGTGLDENGWVTGWCAYAAHRNRVWLLAGPDFNYSGYASTRRWAGFPDVAPGVLGEPVLLLTSNRKLLPRWKPRGATQVWCNGLCALWQAGPGPWAIPLRVTTHAASSYAGAPIYWLDREGMTLEVAANCAGHLRLTGAFVPGPNLPPTPVHRLRVRTSEGHAGEFAPRQGEETTLTVPVGAGRTTIRFVPLDSPSGPTPAGCSAPLLWQVCGLRLQLLAPPGGAGSGAGSETPGGAAGARRGGPGKGTS